MSDEQGVTLTEIHDESEIPDDMTEAEEAEFWSTHSLGEELLDQMEPVPDGLLPPPRNPGYRSQDRFGEGVLLGAALTVGALVAAFALYESLKDGSEARRIR